MPGTSPVTIVLKTSCIETSIELHVRGSSIDFPCQRPREVHVGLDFVFRFTRRVRTEKAMNSMLEELLRPTVSGLVQSITSVSELQPYQFLCTYGENRSR